MNVMGRRVLVCGGRDYRDHAHMKFVLDAAHKASPFAVLIHGGAGGADARAGCWAFSNSIPTEVYYADWTRDGKAAGPIRNLRMLSEGKPDLVVAFPGGKGTAHMRKVARARGVRVVTIAPRTKP
jgi:hypothetical protein